MSFKASEWYEDNEIHHKVEACIADLAKEDSVANTEALCAALDACDDPECLSCGYLVCPAGEPMHFHHDGCPAWCHES